MIIAATHKEAESFSSEVRRQNRSLGLVPTMGALHKGHLSLVDHCGHENDVVVVSIFVNPTQFNDKKDLENYPRDLDKDLRALENTCCDMVFVPDVKTIYPQQDERVFDFGELDKIMEGRCRPGHFNGVAQVVSRLFQIIKPDRSYFGEKDIQQLAVIRKITGMLKLPVEIRGCPTLRESDGLAMSSRNVFLKDEQRKDAALINQTLRESTEKTNLPVNELKQWVTDTIDENPSLDLEYFEIVNSRNLQPVSDWSQCEGELIGCIAVRIGKVRLIDNIFFPKFVP